MRTPRSQHVRLRRILFSALFIIFAFHELGFTETQQQKTYVYNFKYLGMTVANGGITISDTLMADGIHASSIRTHATSLPAPSILFRINNTYHTLVDTATGFPILYKKDIQQSNIREDTHVRFDQKNMRMYNADEGEIVLSAPTHNFFSALYYLMNYSFQPKEVLNFPVYAAGSLWEVMAKAITTEKIVSPVGTYRTVLVEIEFHRHPSFQGQKRDTDVLTNRLLQEGVKTYLWFSTASHSILVKGEYELFPARLQMILSNATQ